MHMMNVVDNGDKSGYYIGMSIPSRQSEFNPNCIVSSETILDYDDFNPPPRQQPPRHTQRRKIRPQQQNRQFYDIKEEEEEDMEHDSTSDMELETDHASNDDIEENDEYYDDDSDDMKQTNPHSNPHSNSHRSNNLMEDDNEYSQIQALQEQLQQQQRQLIIQSQQIKQLKHEIKNQEDEPPSAIAVHGLPAQAPLDNTALTPYHFDDDIATMDASDMYHKHLQQLQQQQVMSSDSDDVDGPFPTLAFDEPNAEHNVPPQVQLHPNHIAPNYPPMVTQNMNNMNDMQPNLAIPHQRSIQSVERGSFETFRQKQIKTVQRSPRIATTPKNPFSRNNSRTGSSPGSPRNNSGSSQTAFTQYNQLQHKRTNSGSSHKSSRSGSKSKKGKLSRRTEINMVNGVNGVNKIGQLIESPRSKSSSHHSSKRKSRSNRSNRSQNSVSHHSSTYNQPSPRYSQQTRERENNNKKTSKTNGSSSKKRVKKSNSSHERRSRKSGKSSIEKKEIEQKLNRKQLNKHYDTVNEDVHINISSAGAAAAANNNVDRLNMPSPHSPVLHSPPVSIGNSPPLSPNTVRMQAVDSLHSHASDSDDASDSYSDGTTGQQHKLADIALPSTYYNSEYGDIHKTNIADLFMDGIPEFEFTEDNLELHNKKLAKLKHTKYAHGSGHSAAAAVIAPNYHHHQHQHLHHHHYHPPTADPLSNILNTQTDSNHLGPMNFAGLSHLSGVSTESQAMSRIFHPTNRMQSIFQNKQKKKKPNLPINPESQYSTAAALDPLDELDNMDVLNNYDKHKELGNGTDAFVYEVVDRRDKSHVAMKLTKRKSGRYKTEIHLLHQLRTCPYIVKLLNCLENDNVYVLILEHAPMSLENLLLQRCTKHPMQERVAKTILSQILKGIRAIHNLGFVHKDIKPENILIFANRSERKLIAKVADFGFATRVAPDASIGSGNITIDNLPREKYTEFEKHVRDRCGTPGFWPPELVTSLCALKYAFKMDVFSAGVTLYRMLCNEMPFGIFESWKYNIDHRDGQKKLCKVKPNWKVISWIQSDNKYTPVLSSRKLSDTVKDLLRSMLRIRPEQRSNVDECLKHAFFANNKTKSNKLQKSSTKLAKHPHHHHPVPPHHYNQNKSGRNQHQHQQQQPHIKRKKRSDHQNNLNHHTQSSRKYRQISNKMKAKG